MLTSTRARGTAWTTTTAPRPAAAGAAVGGPAWASAGLPNAVASRTTAADARTIFTAPPEGWTSGTGSAGPAREHARPGGSRSRLGMRGMRPVPP